LNTKLSLLLITRLSPFLLVSVLSNKHLDNTITTRTNDQASISAPNNTANTLSTHDTMTLEILCTLSQLEIPETNTGIVTGRHCFAAVFAECQS
jgi:hypothetical protein